MLANSSGQKTTVEPSGRNKIIRDTPPLNYLTAPASVKTNKSTTDALKLKMGVKVSKTAPYASELNRTAVSRIDLKATKITLHNPQPKTRRKLNKVIQPPSGLNPIAESKMGGKVDKGGLKIGRGVLSRLAHEPTRAYEKTKDLPITAKLGVRLQTGTTSAPVSRLEIGALRPSTPKPRIRA